MTFDYTSSPLAPRASRTALITGVTGQDGSYLAEVLLAKGYAVHGIVRRCSSPTSGRIAHLLEAARGHGVRFFLHDADLCDALSLQRVIAAVRPDEIYNLAAQSHVGVSFEEPEYTANVDALGTLRLLEAIRVLGMEKATRFYQASTSELFGAVAETPQRECTPFAPRSPYAAAKLYSYWITVNYREGYGMHASNGILFNHESPRRGETFVTRKITLALARIACGMQECLSLGNLDALRDWGHARDYVEMQWLMLQQDRPGDYVIATGEQHSVREFVDMAAAHLGIVLAWSGEGVLEIGTVRGLARNSPGADHLAPGRVMVRVDPAYFRPTEVETLLGDPGKAARELGWRPTCTFAELVEEMMEADLHAVHSALQAAHPALARVRPASASLH